MALLPVSTKLKTEQMIEDGLIKQDPRPYLGMSGLGHECARKLWYDFRICSDKHITPRLSRLFQRGHKEEPIIVADLAKAGIIHHSDQKECVHGNGHIKGHCDGILENVPDAPKTPHLGEFKTANDKSFKDMVKKRLKVSKPIYYGQTVTYMHKFGLKRGLFVMVNKNDDARYYERVYPDPEHAEYLLSRGIDIISSETPPANPFNRPTFLTCKLCDHSEICYMGEEVNKNCRTCQHGDIHDNGIWRCGKLNIELAFSQQLIGCMQYQILEGLK